MSTGDKHFEKRDIQTALKHHLLENYVDKWARVLINSSHNNKLSKVNYVDCFAGKGTFDDGNEGSPKLAMNSLFAIQQNFKFKYKNSINFNIYTIECDKKYHHNLCKLRSESNYPNQIFNFFGKFEEHLNTIIKKTDGAPSLYFIDPFGYTGLPLNKIVEILNKQSHEVLINVMSYSLVRNLKIADSKRGLCEFFGIDSLTNDLHSYIDQIDKMDDVRVNNTSLYKLEDKIIAFYKDQLKKKFNKELYVLSKRIHSKLNPNIYFHLVFASTNIKGLEKMKESFVDFEKTKYKIEDTYALNNNICISTELNMFDDFYEADTYGYRDFLYEIYKYFNNKTTSYREIVAHFLENTPLPYKDNSNKNGIYHYIKKLEKNKNLFSRSNGTISNLGKIDSIIVKLSFADDSIEYLLEKNSLKQLTLF